MILQPTGPVLAREFEHEEVHIFSDAGSGLVGVIAVHSTALGPAVGGLRLSQYSTLDAALEDALRLSRAMTLKNAAAGLNLGGGKAVLIDDGAWGNVTVRRERMLAFGRALERIAGRYITAEDVGTTPDDMSAIAEVTDFVTGLPERSGDPSVATARTVFEAIAVAVTRRGHRDLRDVRVGVLGVGRVGARLTQLLATAGAQVSVADVDTDRARGVATQAGATALDLDGFVVGPFDVLAPCALGGAITLAHVPELRCKVVCGAANNPLTGDDVALAMHGRGILYVPDFLANCGGIIHVGASDVLGFDMAVVEGLIDAATARIREALEEADAGGSAPIYVARRLAQQRLTAAGSATVGALR